jgi:hypothetical protein
MEDRHKTIPAAIEGRLRPPLSDIAACNGATSIRSWSAPDIRIGDERNGTGRRTENEWETVCNLQKTAQPKTLETFRII